MANFVAEQLWGLAAFNGGEEFLVETAFSSDAVAHEDGDAQDDGVFGVVFEYFALGYELGLPVEVGGAGHISGAVGLGGMAVEDHVGGEV